MKGRTGTNTGSIVRTARSDRKDKKRREREAARWEKLAGPVTVTWVEPAAPTEPTSSS